MKNILMLAVMFFMSSVNAHAEQLCFSPVKEKRGDRSSERSWWQPFNYRVQVDNGPILKTHAERSTVYQFRSPSPSVKIWLGGRVVESFRVSRNALDSGRNCIWFNNLFETWSVVEKWQVKKLCSCTPE